MGLLSSLFGKNRDPLEAGMENEKAAMFQSMGATAAQARSQAREFVADARRHVLQQGLDKQPPNLGDTYLHREQSDPKLQASLKALRDEGVTSDDIRWWFNLSALERTILQKQDELCRGALFLGMVEQGATPEDAAAAVWTAHAKFGGPEECKGESDDRPIPIQLKRRIIEYTERFYTDPDELQRRVKNASSFNALVRSEIRSGNL